MKKVMLLAALCAAPALAQDLTHPTDMGLPDSTWTRPDPADYQLTLENGLSAYVAEANQVPLVTMSAFIRAGKVNDENQGAAEALRDALRNSGPSGMGSDEFSASLEQMTASLTVNVGDEWTEVSLNVPTEDLDQALSLFGGILRNPSISDANIERAARGAAPESEPALYEGSMSVAVERFHEILYDGHPYGEVPTSDDYDDLDVDDVADFHARYFVPGNVILAVAGAIDVDDINNRIDASFGDWSAADVPEPRQMPPVGRQDAALHHFRSEKLQSWLVIGNDLPVIPVEEQAAFDVMNYIMGAYHLNTRMMRETRYKFGYTNDASAFAEPHWFGPGSYTWRSYSRPEVIENINENMMGEFVRIRLEEVSDHELFVAIGALADGVFPIQYLDGYALTRSFALERLQYGNHARSASYVDRVRAVTKEDVLSAARKYLPVENMQTVLVGEESF